MSVCLLYRDNQTTRQEKTRRENKDKRHIAWDMVFLEPIGTQYFSCSRVMHQHLNMGRHAQDLLYTVQTDPDTLYSPAALRHSKLFLSKTNAQSEHTHLLLLLLCGDAGAVANPGPYRSLIRA